MGKLRVTVWSEGFPENEVNAIKSYPDDINTAIADFLKCDDELVVTKSHLRDAECGLSQELIDNTDVLVWWSHMYHDDVTDEAAMRVVTAVLQRGMGLLLLHSGLFGKPGNFFIA